MVVRTAASVRSEFQLEFCFAIKICPSYGIFQG